MGFSTSKVTTGLQIGGATAVVAGVWAVCWPAAVIIAGVFAVLAGHLVGDGEV